MYIKYKIRKRHKTFFLTVSLMKRNAKRIIDRNINK